MPRHLAALIGLAFLTACTDTPVTARTTTLAPVQLLPSIPVSVTSAAENALIERIVAYLPAEHRESWANKLRSGRAIIEVTGDPQAKTLIDSLRALRKARLDADAQFALARTQPAAAVTTTTIEETVIALVQLLPEPHARAVVVQRRQPPSSIILVTEATTNADLRHALALAAARRQEPDESQTERRFVIRGAASSARSEEAIIDWSKLKSSPTIDLAGVGRAKTLVIRLKA